MSSSGGKTEAVTELPDDLRGKITDFGPLKDEPDEKGRAQVITHFRFHYLEVVKVKGVSQPVPVLTVEDLRENKRERSLRDEDLAESSGERLFGRYRLLNVIGQGGMGEVWKAKDAFGNTLAIKMLIAGEAASEKQLARFRREADIMSKLQHRNVCRIYEVGEVERNSFIAMEYIDGVPLSQVLRHRGDVSSSDKTISVSRSTSGSLEELISEIKSGGSRDRYGEEGEGGGEAEVSYNILPVQQVLAILMRVCDAIQHAHEHGVMHRDLKPANIMVTPDGDPVVMDFGLSKLENDTTSDMSLSVSGQVVGTVEYMSPEQAKSSKDVNETTDIYSLGAVAYQMLTGHKHFKASGNLLTDAVELENHVPKAPRQWNPRLDVDLETILMKALRPDPRERYRSVSALAGDIDAYLHGRPISARKVTPVEMAWKWCKRNPALSALAAGVLLATVGGTAATIWSLEQGRREARLAQGEAEEAKGVAEGVLKEVRELSARAAPCFLAQAQDSILSGNLQMARDQLSFALDLAPDLSETVPPLLGILAIEEDMDELEQRLPALPDGLLLQAFTSYAESSESPMVIRGLQHAMIEEGTSALAAQLKGGADLIFEAYVQKVKKAFGRTLTRNEAGELSLSLRKMKYPDLTQLEGIPLSGLSLEDCKLTDISALRGLALKHLNLKRTGLRDLSPLIGMPLESLNAEYLRLRSLEFLRGNTTLRSLKIGSAITDDFSPLETAQLRELILPAAKGLDSLEFLRGQPLQRLRVPESKVSDLSPLKGMPLTSLVLSGEETKGGSEVSSLEPLRGMPLKMLSIAKSDVEDLSPLQGMDLEKLWLHDTPISDLSALQGMKLGGSMDLRGTKVEDLSPLKGMPLDSLNLSGLPVEDLSPLEGMPLVHLVLSGTPVKDFSVLSSLKRLSVLEADRSYFDELEPLRESPIEVLFLDDPMEGVQTLDLSPLEGKKFDELHLRKRKLLSLKPIGAHPPGHLDLSHTNVESIDDLQINSTWELKLGGLALKSLEPLRGLRVKRLELGWSSLEALLKV